LRRKVLGLERRKAVFFGRFGMSGRFGHDG